ncbi:hypothetical protein SCA6_010253 [Theobroma cacao]
MINNVGVYLWKPTVEFTTEEFSTLTSANFESASHLCQFSHPLDLKAPGAGSVVFISSMAAVISINIGGSFYSAAKGALNQLTKTLACEWAKDNLRTNCVAPAFIRTPLTKAIRQIIISNFVPLPCRLSKKKKGPKSVISRTPLGRIGEPKEVSSLVAFLCPSVACSIAGRIICVDGGVT